MSGSAHAFSELSTHDTPHVCACRLSRLTGLTKLTFTAGLHGRDQDDYVQLLFALTNLHSLSMVKLEGCQWTLQHIPELPSVLQHMPNLTNLHLPELPLRMELTQLQSLELKTLYSNRALKDLDSLQEMVVWNVIGCLVDENLFRSLGRELANLNSLREVDITFYDATQMAQVLMELLANEHIECGWTASLGGSQNQSQARG